MYFKRYLYPSIVTIKHGITKSLLKKQPVSLLRYSSYCLSKDNNLLMVDKCFSNIQINNGFVVPIFTKTNIKSSGMSTEIQPEEIALKGKVFIESEAMFHHTFLEDSSAYSSTIFKPDPNFSIKYGLREEEFRDLVSSSDWENKSPYNAALAFISFGVYSASNLNVSMDDVRFDRMISAFVNICPSFTDDQIMDCLIAIQFWPQSGHVKAGNFLKVWKALDNLCHERLYEWSLDKILFVMDLWYQIKLPRLSLFVFKGLKKISNKCPDLTSAQMVQTLFYMSCVRKLHPAISMRDYEHYVQKLITYLSIEELGIFALAFFKTKKAILNTKIVLYLMHRVLDEIDSIHQITLTAISKAIRLSHKPEIGFTANDFVNKVVEKRLNSLNLFNAIHVLHISTQVQFYNQEPITKLAELFCKDPSVARLKDMERMAFVLSLFNYIPPSTPKILDIILEELNKPQHVTAGKDHPLTFLSLLYYLTLLQVFAEKQICDVLNEKDLLEKYRTRFMLPVQVLQIDSNRVLEGPPGSKSLLSASLREYLARRYSLFIPESNKPAKSNYDHMFLEVMDLTKKLLGGEKYAMAAYPLPHFPRADILFCLDESGNPLPISEELLNRPHFEDVLRPPDDKKWYVVVLGARNMYMHNTPRLVGEQTAKLRQLQLLGYNTVVIPNHYWMGEKDKLDYLKLKYFTKPEEK